MCVGFRFDVELTGLKMLLAEVKKLKVAELRAMLTQRGLDPKGLKAELVVRLISAIEAGVEPIKSGNEVESTCETTDKQSETQAEDFIKHAYLEHESSVCTNSCNSMRTYTDQSTQTDPNQHCSCAATLNLAEQMTSGTVISDPHHPEEEEQHSDADAADPVAMATAAASVDMDVVSGCSTPVSEIPVSDEAHDQDHCKSV